MFKRLISTVLAVSLISTSVLASELEYPYLSDDAYEESAAVEYGDESSYDEEIAEEYAYDYLADNGDTEEDTSTVHGSEYEITAQASEITLPPAPVATSTGWTTIGRWEERVFDNIVDQMYFNQFRDGFEYIQNLSADINRTITQGNWVMEVLSTVSVMGQPWVRTVFPDDFVFEFDEETGMIIIDESLELEEVVYHQVEAYTFFTLRDTSGTIDLSNQINVGLEENWDSPRRLEAVPQLFAGMANFLFYDEDTNTAVFIVRHHGQFREDDMQSVDVEFTVNRIVADSNTIDAEVAIDLLYLLENHEATFIVEGEDYVFGPHGPRVWGGMGIHSSEALEVFGTDFDPFAPGRELMAVAELNIPLYADVYLTNISLIDNILRVQIASPAQENQWPQERWVGSTLVDTRVETPDWADVDWETITDEEMMDIRNLWTSRFLQSAYRLDRSTRDEDFQQMGRSYMDHAFIIEDLEMLNHIAFEITGSYFSIVQSLNLVAPPFESPVIGSRFAAEQARVTIYGATYTIRNIAVSPLEIRFTIEDAGVLANLVNARDRDPVHGEWFNLHDHIQVELVYLDGTVREYESFTSGMGISGSWRGNYEPSEITLNFGGSGINLSNLDAIRINGVLIPLN